MKKILIVILVTILVNACSKEYGQEDRIVKSETGFLIGWDCQSLPVPIILRYDLQNEKFKQAVFDTVKYFSETFKKQMVILSPTDSAVEPFHKGYISIGNMEFEDCKSGRTSIYLDDYKRYIDHVKIIIRNYNNYQSYYNALIHELGHAFGLKHDDNTCAVMYSQITSSCTFKTNKYSKYDIKILDEFYEACNN